MTAWDVMADSALPILKDLAVKVDELTEAYEAEPPTITAQAFITQAKDYFSSYIMGSLQNLLMIDSTGQATSWFNKLKDLLSSWT